MGGRPRRRWPGKQLEREIKWAGMQAKQLYVQVFGWQAHDQAAKGGRFTRVYRDVVWLGRATP